MTIRCAAVIAVLLLSSIASGCRGRSDQVSPPVAKSPPPPPPREEPSPPPVVPRARPFRILQPAVGEVLRLPDASRHRGIVIRTDPEASIRAACDGEVVFITESYPGIGPAIVVEHAGGYRTVYGPVRARKGLVESSPIRRGEHLGRLADPEALLRFRLMRGDTDVPNLFEFADFKATGTWRGARANSSP